MKLIKSILFTLALAIGSYAHSQTMVPAAFTGSDSVLTDAGTCGIFYTVAAASNPAKIGVQLTITLASGTGAGTCVLYGSLDNMGYDTVMNAKLTPIAGLTVNSTLTSVYTIRNTASQTHTWEVTNPVWKYYKVGCTGSGTESAKIRAKAVAIRP